MTRSLLPAALAALALTAGALAQPSPKSTPRPPAAPAKGQPADDGAGPAPQPEAPQPAPQTEVRKSMVKIFLTSRSPDLTQPWTKQKAEEASGSGVVIAGNRILTNNHMVEYATRVLVQPDGSSDKIPAKVLFKAPGIDLALLTVDDKSFFDAHPPLPLQDELPQVGDTVMAYGYPLGGDALSVTKGIVSRIEYTDFNDNQIGLRIQVDAALNHGNSGGPAVMDNKIVGIVFSGIDTAQNIGYLIPVEEVREFLADVEDGRYDNHPQFYGSMQTLENEALKTFLKIPRGEDGLVVTKPETEKDDYPLKKWDVVSKIGDHNVDSDGMVELRPGLRVGFRYYVPKLAKDGKVPLTIIRDGTLMDVQVPVRVEPNRVIKPLKGAYPSYFVVGPLTFMPAPMEIAQGMNPRSLAFRASPMLSRLSDEPKFEGEQIVIGPLKLLTHPIMKGYELLPFPVLRAVNGTKIRSLRHLVEVIRDSKDEYLTFDWSDEHVETMVFRREDLLKSTDEILEENSIRSQMSDDLKNAWEKK